MPYEKRGYAFTVSMPTIATVNPRMPLIQPLSALPFEVRLPQIMMPNTASRKNSHEVNLRAKPVRTGVSVSTQTTLNSVPIIETVVARNIACPASPRLAIGKPSIAVAAEAGVPGMLSRIADWQPPEIDPT